MRITVATLITCVRIVLIIPLVLFFLHNNYTGYWVCLLVALLSDMLDGYIARRFNQESTLGALLDPLADKLLVATVVLLLWYANSPLIPTWFVILVLVKELLLVVGAVVAQLLSPGKKIQAALPGKIAFVAQAELLLRASLGWTLGTVMGSNIVAVILMLYALGYYICVE